MANRAAVTRMLRTLHRRMGVVVAVLAIWLSITGILLNHSGGLRLADRQIGGWLAAAIYDLQPETVENGFQAGARWLTTAEDQLFFDSKPIASGYQNLLAAVPLSSMFIAAVDSKSITLLLESGELVERLYGADLPVQTIATAAAMDESLLLWSAAGRCFRSTSAELLEWSPCSETQRRTAPARSVALPKQLRAEVSRQLGGAKISWQQLLLDLHSGQAIGWLGRWLADASAVLLILLAGTGLVIVSRRKRR